MSNLHPEYGASYFKADSPQGFGLREEPRMVCFVCVLIARAAVDAAGDLDERFVAWGWEDNDYCRWIRAAGFRLGIEDRCYVGHGLMRSYLPRESGHAGRYLAGQGDLPRQLG